MKKENKFNIWRLIISLILPFLASVIGSIFTASSVSDWYLELNKPSFNPPNWLFGPVWTVLYLLMGVSLYLVWTNKKDKTAFVLFGTQLFLNTLWSIIFFGLHQPLFAFIEIIILIAAIIATTFVFYKINKTAAYLMIPYILWVIFASVLNFYLFLLN